MQRILQILIASGFFVSGFHALHAGTGPFDSSTSLTPVEDIFSGGPAKDEIPALTHPRMVRPPEADYLNPDDLVAGISVNGNAQAYPLRILVWHELVNDLIEDQPILVSYCPLCQSVLVFSRQVGGSVREFGVSGLLYQSNVLMYDRQESLSDERLWSQIEMRAVTGPAAKAGLKLELLHSELTTWADWVHRYPDTHVLSERTGHRRPYRKTAYASYFTSDALMFPVDQTLGNPAGFKNKDLMAVVYTPQETKAYHVEDLAKSVDDKGILSDKVGNRQIQLTYLPKGNTVRIDSADSRPAHPSR